MNLLFWVLCAVMLIIAGGFVLLLPSRWRRHTTGESTVDWVNLRRSELTENDAQLLDDVELRALEDLGGPEVPSTPSERTTSIWWIPIAVALMSAALYQHLGSLEDVAISAELGALEPTDDTAITQLIERIEDRVRARPENIDYLSILGQYHATRGDHPAAKRVYEQLLTLLPESPEVLGRAAQAAFFSDGRVLNPTARRRAEAALAIDPNQRSALGTLGMAAFEAEEFAAAVEFWSRMLALEPPGTEAYAMMESIVNEARQRAGQVPPSPEGILIEIEAPELADIPAGTTLFVLARASDSASRMPAAVTRVTTSTWPLKIRLSDSDSMAGQRLSALESVVIEAQVSPSGQPGRANASWFAQADNVVVSGAETVSLILTPATTSQDTGNP